MIITYYGHSCVGVEAEGKHLLIDPFISPNPQAAHIHIDTLKVDYILISHAHYDHIMDVEAIAQRTGAIIISNHEIATYYGGKGFTTHGMNFGGSWNFDFGKVKMVNAIHSSSFPTGENGGNPAGFVISSENKSIYFAGDTALTMDMKLIPMFYQLDLAMLPVGGNFTMDIEEALVAADFVQCNRVLGIHYNTAEAITIKKEEAERKFQEQGKELILLPIGSGLTI